MSTSFLVPILVASVIQFIIGAVWYTPLFGALWAKIHGFDRLSPEAQAGERARMLPLLGAQFGVTVLTTTVLAYLYSQMISISAQHLALLLWLGFVVPTQVSAVLFGGTEPRWVVVKITLMAGASFLCLMSAAVVLSVW